MTHILLNVEYSDLLPILKDEKVGEKMIHDWCNYNNHTLVKRPEMHVFPATYVDRKNKNQWWTNSINAVLGDSFTYIDHEPNEVVVHHSYHGYTGFGILKESHISIHTYPEEKCMHVDLFSCKQLDYKKNQTFMHKYFQSDKAKTFKIEFINRAL